MKNRLARLDPSVLLLDLDQNIWIFWGVPLEVERCQGHVTVTFPNHPHIFTAHNLYINDKNNAGLHLEEVTVIIGHGYRQNNIWKFANGQLVVETIHAYNQYALTHNLPKIEMVIACNETERLENDIQVLIQDMDADEKIAQVVGVPVYINQTKSWVSEGGVVHLAIWTDEIFWGLDELIEWRSVKREIQLLADNFKKVR